MGLTGRSVPGNRWDLLDGRQPSPLPMVSVIVTHFDQHRELERTLRALSRQEYPAELVQVIVADDGSRSAPDVPADVMLVRQADDGFRAAAARNLGASHAIGDVLCFLDADTAPEPAYLRRMTRLPGLLPEAVVVGRRRHADLSAVAIDAPVEVAGPAHALPDPAWLADAYARSRNLLDADDRSYRYVLSAVFACTRRFFDDVGGFDESFTSYGGEDWEWAHRAWRDGAVFAHVPHAVAWHDGADWAGRDDSDAAVSKGAVSKGAVSKGAVSKGAVSKGAVSKAAGKNIEALRLARLIPVAGSRARGLLLGEPDVVVRLAGQHEAAAIFVCIDALLEALPHSQVVVTDATALGLCAGDERVGAGEASVADARVVGEVMRPFAVVGTAGEQLAKLMRGLGSNERGAVIVIASDGQEVLHAKSRRAVRRRERWGTDACFRTDSVRIDGVIALRPQPDVEAWLGGWAGPEQLR